MKKPNIKFLNNQGFTLIEMLVVVGIISMITGIFLVNFRALEGPRNLRIAQNTVITDIRKIQSYTLASRNVAASGNPAKYYIIGFNLNSPSSYTLSAIDNQDNFFNLQTINLPKSIIVSDVSMKLQSGTTVQANCNQTAFALPFGRVFMEYKDQKNFNCDIASTFANSSDLSPYKNLTTVITLRDVSSANGGTRTIEINGISQAIQGN